MHRGLDIWDSKTCLNFNLPYEQEVCYGSTNLEYGNAIDEQCLLSIDTQECTSCSVYKFRDENCYEFDCSNTISSTPDKNPQSGSSTKTGKSSKSKDVTIVRVINHKHTHTHSLTLMPFISPSTVSYLQFTVTTSPHPPVHTTITTKNKVIHVIFQHIQFHYLWIHMVVHPVIYVVLGMN